MRVLGQIYSTRYTFFPLRWTLNPIKKYFVPHIKSTGVGVSMGIVYFEVIIVVHRVNRWMRHFLIETSIAPSSSRRNRHQKSRWSLPAFMFLVLWPEYVQSSAMQSYIHDLLASKSSSLVWVSSLCL